MFYDKTISLKLTQEQYEKLVALFPHHRSETIRALIDQLIEMREQDIKANVLEDMSFDELLAKIELHLKSKPNPKKEDHSNDE